MKKLTQFIESKIRWEEVITLENLANYFDKFDEHEGIKGNIGTI